MIVGDTSKFDIFFQLVVNLVEHSSFAAHAHLQLQYVCLLVNAYQCMEKPAVHQSFVGKCLSLSLWKSISAERLSVEVGANPGL